MQNKNRFIKIDFKNPDDAIQLNKKKIIHVLFFTDKNIIISKGMDNHVDLSKFLKSFLINNPSNNIVVRSEKGSFLLVKRKAEDTKLNDDYLERLGGKICEPSSLYIISYSLETLDISSGE